jgi:hypothetical protein
MKPQGDTLKENYVLKETQQPAVVISALLVFPILSVLATQSEVCRPAASETSNTGKKWRILSLTKPVYIFMFEMPMACPCGSNAFWKIYPSTRGQD